MFLLVDRIVHGHSIDAPVVLLIESMRAYIVDQIDHANKHHKNIQSKHNSTDHILHRALFESLVLEACIIRFQSHANKHCDSKFKDINEITP